MTTQLALAPDGAEHWVQNLDPYLATQALIGFGLWSEADGIAPPESLEAAYRLAERTLGLSRQAISFRAEGIALVCHFVYADRAITASAQPQGKQKAESGKMKGHAMQSSDICAPTYDSQLSAFSSQLSLAQPQGKQKAESGKMKGHAMQSSDICAPTYDSQLSAFSSQLSLALALTRAVLRAAYEARLI